jgi:hypothetical protein
VQVGAALPTRQRRPGYAALAVVLIVGFAALGVYFYNQAGAKTPVVVVARDVPAGHVITRADLSKVDLAGAVTAVGGNHIDSVVGQTATVHLLPGTVLQRSMVSSTSPLGADQALVGVQLRPGQLPDQGVSAGDTVQVLLLPPANVGASSQGSALATTMAAATVYSSSPDPSQSGGTLVTVLVPKASAAAVASASNAGLVALVRVGS